MKNTALIVVSAFFAMGIAFSAPVFATDSGLISGMKGIAKEHAKEMVNEEVQQAGDAANKKIDELAGNTMAPGSEAVDKAMETKEKAEAVKENATHEMEDMKGDVEKHKKAMENMMHGWKDTAK